MASEAPPSGTATPESAAPSGASSEVERSSPPKKPKKGARSTINETIQKGKTLRVQKSSMPKKVARQPPSPAYPKGLVPTVRDVRMSRRQMRRQARCLRTYNIVLTDRMDQLAKPTRRQLIDMWRTYHHILSPEQIHNLQNMLDASDPFKPDQAYEFFSNLRKQKKKPDSKEKSSDDKKVSSGQGLGDIFGDQRFAWARGAAVALARGIMRRLGRPTHFQLEDNMLRLSNRVLTEMCCYNKMKVPSRRSRNCKARFMVDMADKLAVWMDEVLSEADERMLLMDGDEDDDVEREQAGPELAASPSGSARASGTATPAGADSAPASAGGPATPTSGAGTPTE